MTQFNFNTPPDRKGTDSLKWDIYKKRDIIPLWVADMDFQSPDCVIDALEKRIKHGIFGYTCAPEELTDIIILQLKKNYGWEVNKKWIVWLPGLVTGINVSCRSVGLPGDEIITTVPVYPPFLSAPHLAEKKLVTVDMISNKNNWEIDFKQLESRVTGRTKLLLFCSPHNPLGKVFSRQELKRLVNFCIRKNIIICSDEIHSGLILDKNKKHIPTASIDENVAERTITLMAPSKTYNLPGLGFSFGIIPDAKLRNRFTTTMEGIVPHVNALGFTAALAAYKNGRKWHQALIKYLRNNRDYIISEINNIPCLSTTHVEATYLAWIDARKTGLKNPVVFFENAGVGLFDGKHFGAPGFLRLNFACPKVLLSESISRIKKALTK